MKKDGDTRSQSTLCVTLGWPLRAPASAGAGAAASVAMTEEVKKAQAHLDAEEDGKALEVAGAAVTKFREAGDMDGLADAVLLNACAYIAKGMRKEANKLAQDELASFTKAGHKTGQAKMYLAIAEANSQHRGGENKVKALEAAGKAQEMFAKLMDKRMEAKAHIVTANIQIAKGNAAEAIRIANTAKALSQSADDKRGEGIAEHCIAVACAKGDDAVACIRAVKAAIACFREVGLRQMEALQHICLAKWTNELERKPAKALQLALKAQAFCRSCGCQEHLALAMIVDCYLSLAKNDSTLVGSTIMSAKAVRAAQDGVAHFQAAGNRIGEAHGRQSLAMAQMSQGFQDEAAQTAQSAAGAFREVGDNENEIQMLLFASNLYHKAGRSNEAAGTAEAMLKKAETTPSKVAALEAAFNAYMLKKEYTKAKDTAKKMSDILRQAKSRQKEALARLLMCQACYKSQDFSTGVSVAKDAQVVLHDAKDVAGEARAFRTIAKIHFFANEFEFAVRAAIKARDLVREVGDHQAEGDAALLLANIRLQMLQSLDDRTTNEVYTSHFFEMVDAAKEAKWIGKSYGNKKLVAISLKLMAEAYTMVNEIPDALKFTAEAARLLRAVEDDSNLAYLLMVEAEAWFEGGERQRANQSCKQALKIFQELGDEGGKAKAEDTMERINPPTPPPEPTWEPEDAKIPEAKVVVAKPKEEEYIGAAYKKKQLSKVNLNKIDDALLTSVLYNVVQEVVGYEMDFLEDDLPLMQAGIASRQAVTLRAALEDELHGISFPATIVFDFPTIANIKEYIMDQS